MNPSSSPALSPLEQAFAQGNDYQIDQALSQLRPGDLSPKQMENCLFLATSNRHATAVEKLLEAGGDVNVIQTHRGKPSGTLLEAAIVMKDEDTALLLLDRGFDLGLIKNPTEFLRRAACDHMFTVFHRMIEAGVDVNGKENMGRTPLHGATMSGDVEAMEALILAGADVNARDESDMAPLHFCIQNSEQSALLLLSNGADPHLRSEHCLSPLETAKESMDQRCYEAMRQFVSMQESKNKVLSIIERSKSAPGASL